MQLAVSIALYNDLVHQVDLVATPNPHPSPHSDSNGQKDCPLPKVPVQKIRNELDIYFKTHKAHLLANYRRRLDKASKDAKSSEHANNYYLDWRGPVFEVHPKAI